MAVILEKVDFNHLRYYTQQFGWKAILGLFLLISSLIAILCVGSPKYEHIEQLSSEILRLRADISNHRGKWIEQSPRASANTLYDVLPDKAEVSNILLKIFNTANSNSLFVDKMDYAFSVNQYAVFSRYQITFPLKGDYISIRRFINQTLNQNPSIALKEISFKRDSINTNAVEARLVMVLYLKRAA